MGDTLAVEENDVGQPPQFLEGLEQRRPFPEGQKPREIRESDVLGMGCLLDGPHRWPLEDDDSRKKAFIAPGVGDIGPGHVTKPPEMPMLSDAQFLAKGTLDFHGLPGCDIPGMQMFDFHDGLGRTGDVST
jgi:hypothetical protein